MHARLRKGDNVIVISGGNKGKTGKIKSILRDEDKVIIEGVNLVKRHLRPTPRNPNGGILEKEAPLHACVVMPVDPSTGKPTRVRMKIEDGKKVRVAAKSGTEIPAAKAE